MTKAANIARKFLIGESYGLAIVHAIFTVPMIVGLIFA